MHIMTKLETYIPNYEPVGTRLFYHKLFILVQVVKNLRCFFNNYRNVFRLKTVFAFNHEPWGFVTLLSFFTGFACCFGGRHRGAGYRHKGDESTVGSMANIVVLMSRLRQQLGLLETMSRLF